MYLGVYWYFAFPEELYRFELVRFRPGSGGHGNMPAELSARIRATDPTRILDKVHRLMDRYTEGGLYAYRDGHYLEIGTGGDQLFDYDIGLMQEVERLLLAEEVIPAPGASLKQSTLIRIPGTESQPMAYPSLGIFQVVGSPLRRYGAEVLSLRLDCHLDAGSQSAFLDALSELCVAAGIGVLYYYEAPAGSVTNLMILLSNGRQGLSLQPKHFTQIPQLEQQAQALMRRYGVEQGHASGRGTYPQQGPVVLHMKDQDFMLGN